MKRYGYIRVSTKEQNPERQCIALQEYDIPRKNIYMDQMSGKNFKRPQYHKAAAGGGNRSGEGERGKIWLSEKRNSS